MPHSRIKIFQYIFYIFIFIMVLALFYRFTVQNSQRIQEQNLVYAEDAARQTAMRINDTLVNSLALISQYAKFLSFTLQEPAISARVLKEIEQNSPFNTVRFSDVRGINYSSDGAVNNAEGNEYFKKGMKGESGVSVRINAESYGQTVLGFYAPVYFQGKVIGVLRGNFLADSYLRDLQKTNFFGKPAQVFLCMPDGNIIANSSSINYEGNIEELLLSHSYIDTEQKAKLEKAFKNSEAALVLNAVNGATDNICMVQLPSFNYFLVQAFPPGVTASMVQNANITGIQLELSLLFISALLACFLLIRSKIQKKALERENRFYGTVVKGMSTIFKAQYIIANLDTNEYSEFSGTLQANNIDAPKTGLYSHLIECDASSLNSKESRKEYLKFFQPDI